MIPARKATTLAHLAGAQASDFRRTDTRELFAAVTAAINAGAQTKPAILAALPGHLREHAEWIDQAGAEQSAAIEMMPAEKQQKHAAEMVTALRMLNVRRELDEIRTVLADDLGNLESHRRVVALSAFIREANKVFPRAEGLSRAAFVRERKLPNRAPVAQLDQRNRSAG